MNKPIVFISHITEEKDLAYKVKELIEESFLEMMEVFVSSDGESIGAGARWLDNITDSLNNCSIELILCSPESVKRPWVNFEAGAGWVRSIPVIPLCHSGMKPEKLPIPLNMLQAINLNEVSGLKLLAPVLATAINSRTPKIDFGDFIDYVKEFEKNYTLGNSFLEMFKIINGPTKELLNSLDKKEAIGIKLGFLDNDIIKKLKLLEEEKLSGFIEIKVGNSGMVFPKSGGAVTGGDVFLKINDSSVLIENKKFLLDNL
ncbi:toll/interleukin-1 receptor domain-containing protein [Clostridium perfringens]|uniref:toll/interleukin-1 receptor domain-containing protein n=1 Tax=Clostridium perfringens TaxID=1502 RepID=UPI0028CF2A22|nr:toll/interleukin-1 receptor domain-containing protein [Clostridium perfringens]MDK0669362.1 toll/interleukin-1 receptor domain-containing protein [Clostridium perfringens]MDT7986915.1 toll/interleukin-1 receptor domain-containing protein [Clostridium perfringens]